MADKPIIFSSPMVLALLAGTKSQTRRVLKPQPYGQVINYGWQRDQGAYWTDQSFASHKLPIWAGDRLWVKEKWSGAHTFRDVPPSKRESLTTPDGPVLREDVWYWADGNPTGGDYEKPRPSLFMPRYASRITLLVDDVKVERLQDISEDDAIAEGVETERCCGVPSDSCGVHLGGCCGQPEAIEPIDAYRQLWDHINGAGSWERNPWIYAVRFRVVLENIDYIGRAAA